MVELCEWRPKVTITSAPYAQAQIDIVKSDPQGFVESTDFIVHLAADHKACCGNRTELLGQAGAPHLTEKASPFAAVSVRGHAMDTKDHASVLNCIVWIIEHGSHSAN